MDAFKFFVPLCFLFFTACQSSVENKPEVEADRYLQISGIYPHLTAYNQPEDSLGKLRHLEGGIGAVVPWANHLWYLTYPPHQRSGSNDKLYMVDENMNLSIRPESVGGTHANRMIHQESQQLIIGPYFIDTLGNVRAADVQQLEGRLTATTRHLTDTENMVYFYDMEGMVYEVNVHTLAVKRLFEKPVPGWHGKGAYLGQSRLIVANNGEHQGHPMGYSKLLAGGPAENPEEAGVLAEWDGTEWRIIERKQFTDVTGPGGIYGNGSDDDPVWSMGWDKRSVILKLLDNGTWYTYRLPKASHAFDPRHGWFTEWPRIRAVSEDRMMMAMHATLFDFPKAFSRSQSGGIAPLATHLRYIPDFGYWKDRVILAADDASRMQNPIVGQPQSNLWFGKLSQLATFGPKIGWGGVWIEDAVKPGQPSDAFLLNGYAQRVLHLTHDLDQAVTFTLELDAEGNNQWTILKAVTVGADGYHFELLPTDLRGTWLRLKTDQACVASAFLHYYSSRSFDNNESALFGGLADIEAQGAATAGLIRPAGHNRSLQMVLPDENNAYWEVNLNEEGTDLTFAQPKEEHSREVLQVGALAENPYTVDDASVILSNYDGQRFRLPKGDARYESIWSLGKPRALREVQSERYLANIQGQFYEIPRAEGAGNHVPEYRYIKPVSRHDKQITDYCSWRGLLVLTGVKQGAKEDGQVFTNGAGMGLWFGAIDDLWKLGKPSGIGGPWKNTPVKTGEVSDPYLMTGFDHKQLELSHDANQTVKVRIEVAIHHQANAWQTYQTVEVPAGETFKHEFPKGFHAHWVRLWIDQGCKATAIFRYD
ncbi:MAG: hypothetical protein R2828_02915 [Saprospiraceae bacterium]